MSTMQPLESYKTQFSISQEVQSQRLSDHIAIIILSHNEEKYIDACLASAKWCDEIWIVDSGSSDRTLDIARHYTRNIIEHTFTDFSESRNWALKNLSIQHDWILFLDSDERISPELHRELHEMRDDNVTNGYFVSLRQYFWGQWLKHGGSWPNYTLRLFRKGKGAYSKTRIHEFVQVEGETKRLNNPIIHISRSTMSEALRKLDQYTTLEAERLYRSGGSSYVPKTDDSFTKRILKRIYPKIPGKPFFQFIYSYLILQGFRDGYIGFVWALLQSIYIFTVNFKLRELQLGSSLVEKSPR